MTRDETRADHDPTLPADVRVSRGAVDRMYADRRLSDRQYDAAYAEWRAQNPPGSKVDEPAAPAPAPPATISVEDAKERFRGLVGRYGLQWGANVPKEAYEVLRECNAVLTERTRREALGLRA